MGRLPIENLCSPDEIEHLLAEILGVEEFSRSCRIGETCSIHHPAELKYDGERAQIHLMDNGQVVVFSRNSENTTEKYPELRSAIRAATAAAAR
eukprot:scaffold1442_cov151-Pinguiococcus_pyrenoidosus.AAC.1